MPAKPTYKKLEKRIQELEQAESDRKRIEKSLRESEDKFSKAFYLSPDSISLSSLETGGLIDVNKGFEDMFGYKRKEVIGIAVGKLGLYENISDRESMIEIIKRDGHIRNFEIVGKSKFNRTFIGEISSEIIEVNKEKCLLTIVHDVTERKQIETHRRYLDRINQIIIRAKQPDQMFTSLLDELITIFDCDRAFLIFPADPSASSYKVPMERTREEWPGADVLGVEIQMDPATATLFQKILKSKEPYTVGPGSKYDVPKQFVEHFHVKSIISLAVHPILGKPWLIGMHQCSHGRVWETEEKELFNDMGRRFADGLSSLLFYQELRQTKNYLSNIINSMSSVLVGVDPEGTVTQWNSGAERATGVLLADALGQPLGQVIPHLSQEMEQVHKAMEKRKEQADSKRSRQENGDTRYEDIIIYPLIANGVEGAVIRIDDVTEQVRLEEMMIQSEKMLSVGGLAAGMAHEINNPLAGMIQTANVMANRLTNIDMPANIRAAKEAGISMDGINAFMEKRDILHMITAITASGKRVAELVDNMLGFARKSDNIVSSHDPAVLLDKILEIAVTDYDLKKQYDFKTIKIVKEYENHLPMLPCEGAKIQQVLLNILRNGAQAMHETRDKDSDHKSRFILRLSQETQTKMLHMEIEDNGPGMDEKTRKRIFEPFFTTKPIGVGTGLGLSVSYFIITENHGGEMSVESTPGSGAKFIIRLPLEGRKTRPNP